MDEGPEKKQRIESAFHDIQGFNAMLCKITLDGRNDAQKIRPNTNKRKP